MNDLQVSAQLTIPAAELSESFVRSSGPGGQNVNKVASKVELRWNVTDSAALTDWQRGRIEERLANRISTSGVLVVTSDRTRDQSRNREDARKKLADLVAEALAREKKRIATRPSRGSTERRLADKRHRSQRKRQREIPDD